MLMFLILLRCQDNLVGSGYCELWRYMALGTGVPFASLEQREKERDTELGQVTVLREAKNTMAIPSEAANSYLNTGEGQLPPLYPRTGSWMP